jgi:cyclase
MKSYLEYVYEQSRRFFAAELDVLEAAKRIDLGPYASWTEPERVIFNVARAYRELRDEPYDAPVDVAAMLRAMGEVRRAHGAQR